MIGGHKHRRASVSAGSSTAAAEATVGDDLAVAGAQHLSGSTDDVRMTQLALDLHDGPLQDLAVAAANVALLQDQLRSVVVDAEARDRLIRAVDAAGYALSVVDHDLRNLAWSMRSAHPRCRSLPEALRDALEEFETETGIASRLELPDATPVLSAAVRTTFLQVTREALANVKRHSEASEVRVALRAGAARVELEIADDGRGFEVERRLSAATSEGRLGVVGMGERVRCLGGSLELVSRPGGPTRVIAAIRAPVGAADA